MISQEELGDQETVSPEFADARVDWIENPEAHVIKIDLPGVRREEVKVEVETGRILQIYGERRCEEEEEEEEEVGEKEKEKYFMTHRMERRSGKFHRLFKLPENAKMDLTEASMRNGVLTVTVPKEEVKVIEISDDSLMDQNDTVLRAKSTADKGKAVLEDAAKDVKRIEISGENSRCLKIIKMD